MEGAPSDYREMWEDIAMTHAIIGALAAQAQMMRRANELLNRAISFTEKRIEEDRRERIIAFVAEMMAQSGRYSEAEALALSIGNKNTRNSAIKAIINVLANHGKFHDALKLQAYYTETSEPPIFAIASNLMDRNDISNPEKIDIVSRSFHDYSTRDSFNFWQCFRAMLPVLDEIGQGALLVDTWRQIQKVSTFVS